MKRTTVELPDDLELQLRNEAARRQTTISDLTREAIEAYLRPGRRRRLIAAGAGASGESDISERVEEILREEFPPS
jgi:predicted transcriptional regulator